MEWSVTEQGPRAVIEVTRPDLGDGLYKVWAVGQRGSCLLGTLMPEGGRLTARRTLSIDGLRRQGVWPIMRMECRLVHPFQGNTVSIPWIDEILRRSARRLPGHTVHRSAEGFMLTVPFDPRVPFPLVPLFCLSRVENGRLIFSFRTDGTPYIFRSDGKDRKETDWKGGPSYGKSDHQGAGRAGGSAGL